MMKDLFYFDYPNVWAALEDSPKPVVLYGMGNAADRVLDEFDRRGISAAGVMASDDFVRYQEFRGFTVKKQSNLEHELGDFTVALCFGSSLSDVMRHIRSVASQHELLVPNIPVVGDELMDEAFIEVNRDDIQRAYELLADDRSRRVFKGALDFFYTGRLGYLSDIESDKDEIFCEVLRLNGESYLDLGAYRGDTVDEFLHYSKGYESIVAVEPNPKNYAKLCEHIRGMENVTAINAAIADKEGVMRIGKKSGRMPTLGDSGGVEVPVVSVDSLGYEPTYIKVDIEGMESAMLIGAEDTLRRCRPKLNLAAYHRTGDFFSLILQLSSIRSDYRIYLRKHPYIPCWDLNIYAV